MHAESSNCRPHLSQQSRRSDNATKLVLSQVEAQASSVLKLKSEPSSAASFGSQASGAWQRITAEVGQYQRSIAEARKRTSAPYLQHTQHSSRTAVVQAIAERTHCCSVDSSLISMPRSSDEFSAGVCTFYNLHTSHG